MTSLLSKSQRDSIRLDLGLMTNAGFSSKRGVHDPDVDDTFAIEVDVQMSDAVTTVDGDPADIYFALQFRENAIAVGENV